MANLFLSYQRDREAAVKALAADLGTLGHTVWFDRELSGGERWWTQILAAVRNCDVFLFVLDPKSLASVPCQREYGYATALNKRILPVLAADGVSLHLLPPELSAIQFVDLRARTPEAILSLVRALHSLPPPEAPPDPLPPEPEVPLSPLSRLAHQIDAPVHLSHEAQSVLLLELKRSLADPALSADAEPLLAALRRRPDLLASIAAEIDALPKVARSVETATPETNGLEEESLNDRQVAARAFWVVSLFAATPAYLWVHADATGTNSSSPWSLLLGMVPGAEVALAILIIGVSKFTMLLLLAGSLGAFSAILLASYPHSMNMFSVTSAILFTAPGGAIVTAIAHRIFTWWRRLK